MSWMKVKSNYSSWRLKMIEKVNEKARILGVFYTRQDWEKENQNPYQPIRDNDKFYIKSISYMYNNSSIGERYQCLVRNLNDEKFSSHAYDEEEFCSFVEKKFFVFTPGYDKYNNLICDNPVRLKDNLIGSGVTSEMRFYPVPLIDISKLKKTLDSIEYDITNLQRLNLNVGMADDSDNPPKLIMVRYREGNSIRQKLYGGVQNFVVAQGCTTIKIDGEAIKKAIQFDNIADVESVIQVLNDNIVFFPEDLYFHYAGEELPSLEYESSYTANETKLIETNYAEEVEPIEKYNEEPTQDYSALEEYVNNSHFRYQHEDLIRFNLALKTSALVILAGMSGTGKSQLVRLYSESFGLDKYDGFCFIPVSPSWTDDSDLLGYVDSTANKYIESESYLVSFLLRAEKHPDKEYVVCFDEMNLAKIEHYFSKFISLLELEGRNRVLHLYAQTINVNNKMIYPDHIKIGDNVHFVGTVNVDESTFNFSDKLLDRAHIINLHLLDFKEVTAAMDKCALTERQIGLLQDLQDLMHKFDPKLGIGYRILDQMNKYMEMARQMNEKNYYETRAFDDLLVQRIIPKIRGGQQILEGLIGHVEHVDGSETLVDSEFCAKLDEYSDVSEFLGSRNAIMLKARELEINGYTI